MHSASWKDIQWPAKLSHVPKEIFVREDVFEEEIRRIYHGPEWHPVAHAGEIPNIGDFKTYTLARVPLLITRGKDNQVRAFYNSCSHRGNQVETASCGNKQEFECPYHRWLFDNSGQLIGCPRSQDDYTPGFSRADHPLVQPRTAIVHGIVFVTFSADTPSIEEFLQGLEPRLLNVMAGDGRIKLLGYQKVRIKTNWKVFGDNDAYHAPLLHSAFRLLNWQGGKGSQFALSHGHRGFVSELTLPKAQKLLKDASLIEYKGNDFAKGSCSVHLFPLFVAIRHMDSIALRFANPTSVDETEVHYAYFHHEDDDEEMIRHRIRQSSNLLGPCGMVSMEDLAVFHRMHIGSFTPGNAVFHKGVKDEYSVPTEYKQNDETANIPKWEYYKKIMGFVQEGK